jgi:hypothetical protein
MVRAWADDVDTRASRQVGQALPRVDSPHESAKTWSFAHRVRRNCCCKLLLIDEVGLRAWIASASVCASYMPPAVSDRPAGGKTYTAAFHFVAVEKSLEQAPRPFLRCHAYQQRCRLRVRNGNAPSLVRIAALARTRPASIEARNPGLLLEEGETDLRVAQAAIYAT